MAIAYKGPLWLDHGRGGRWNGGKGLAEGWKWDFFSCALKSTWVRGKNACIDGKRTGLIGGGCAEEEQGKGKG